MRSGLAHGRRFFRTSLQPIAEHLEYNPVAVAARYRSNYLGSVSLPPQQTSSYSSGATDKPKREGSTPDELPGQALDPNRVPPEGSQGSSGASKGHSSPTREELESGSSDSASTDSGSPTPGPSGRPSDSHATAQEGVQRNARPGEFAPNDPKKPGKNIPEHSRGTSGQ